MSERSVFFFFVTAEALNLAQVQNALASLVPKATDFGFTFIRNKPVEPANILAEIRRAGPSAASGARFRFLFQENDEYDVSVAVSLSDRLALVLVNVNFFLQHKTVSPVRAFLRRFYRDFQPTYGYGSVAPTVIPRPEAIREGNLIGIYGYNFLSPQVVDNYGLARLEALPAWQIDILEPDGLFIGLVRNPLYSSSYAKRRREAERMLEIANA